MPSTMAPNVRYTARKAEALIACRCSSRSRTARPRAANNSAPAASGVTSPPQSLEKKRSTWPTICRQTSKPADTYRVKVSPRSHPRDMAQVRWHLLVSATAGSRREYKLAEQSNIDTTLTRELKRTTTKNCCASTRQISSSDRQSSAMTRANCKVATS